MNGSDGIPANKGFFDLQAKYLGLLLLFPFVLFLYFPSINFSIINAEVFPWAIIFSLLIIRTISIYQLLYLILLCMSSFYVLLFKNPDLYPEVVRSVAAYINPFIVFTVLLKAPNGIVKLNLIVLRGVFYSLLTLAFLQFFNLVGFLVPIIDLLMQRGGASIIGEEAGRGVSLLSSEPSRAAYELIFIYLAFRLAFLDKRHQLFFDLLVSCVVVVLIRSAVGAFFVLAFWLIYYNYKFVLIILLASGLLSLGVEVSVAGRAWTIIIGLLSSGSINEIYFYLLNASGFRLISIVGAFLYSIVNPFGGGVGDWRTTSIDALSMTGISPSNLGYFSYYYGGEWASVRPTSYFSSLLLDFGVFGSVVVVTLLTKVLKSTEALRMRLKKYTRELVMFLLYFITAGEVGNPVPWVCMALILRTDQVARV